MVPKYRKRVLQPKVAKRLRELFQSCSEVNGWDIHQLEILTEHVHLLIQLKQTDSPAHVMHYLKGGSSKVLRQEFPELEAFLWGDSFWADGYFVETVGRKNEEMIKHYLDGQQRKHRS